MFRYILVILSLITNLYAEQDCELAAKLLVEGVQISDGSDLEKQKYLDAIKSCSVLPEAYYNLGVLHFNRKEYEKADVYFKKAVELRANAEDLAALAKNTQELGYKEQAIDLFQKALAKDGNNISALTGLSRVYFMENDYKASLDLLNRARVVDSKNDSVILDIALIKEKLGEYEDACVELEAFLKQDPENSAIILRLGILNFKKITSKYQSYI